MAFYDLTTNVYPGNGKLQIANGSFIIKKTIKGSDLTALSITDGGAEDFKIANVGQKVKINRISTTILDADDTALTLKIGYYDGTNDDDDAFDADIALNATGTTTTIAGLKADTSASAFGGASYLYDAAVGADFYITITPSALSTLDDATEFIIEIEGVSWADVSHNTTVNAPV